MKYLLCNPHQLSRLYRSSLSLSTSSAKRNSVFFHHYSAIGTAGLSLQYDFSFLAAAVAGTSLPLPLTITGKAGLAVTMAKANCFFWK